MPPANRMTLATFKGRMIGAKKGHSLLKKKRDALKAKFQAMLKEIVECKLTTLTGLKEASFTYAKAQWATAGDDITSTVIERTKRATITCTLSGDNVAGVQLPKFTCMHDPTKDTSATTLGLGIGGAVVDRCRQEYLKAIIGIVKLASLQTAFKTLDEEIKMTSRRVNALEYVLIPRIVAICHYITQEMDEEAREEFFRVKKVVDKKRLKLLREKAELEKENAAKGLHNVNPMDAPSALPQSDPDVVFS